MQASLLESAINDESVINSAAPPDAGAILAAHKVSHAVRCRRGFCRSESKAILKEISCRFESSTLTAILGPSGAGKSTLLSVLRTGRCTSGSLTIDGVSYNDARGAVASVPQDDVLLPGLTPLEMLGYAAELRLRGVSNREERKARVLAVLKRLHLDAVDINTRIGNVDERGLSGGQRKRVSIGLELIASPRVLLLDEPTSGLDAKMAWSVVRILRSLSRDGGGQTIIASIHQPSWRVFTEFSSALILTRGAVAYAGSVDKILSHFSSLGFECGANENPADYFMFLLQVRDT